MRRGSPPVTGTLFMLLEHPRRAQEDMTGALEAADTLQASPQGVRCQSHHEPPTPGKTWLLFRTGSELAKPLISGISP